MAWIAVTGPLLGVLVGWYMSTQANHTPSPSTATPQQISQIREFDRLASSALASLRTYEKRILTGKHLETNGSSATKAVASETLGDERTSPCPPSSERMRLRQPLDGKTLLAVKREANENIQDCTNALTRATAVLEEETVVHARNLVDRLVAILESLETQEAADEVSADQVQTHMLAAHQSRTRLLNAARKRLGIDPLSEETQEGIENLTQQVLSPSTLPRPFVTDGIRPVKPHS